MVQILLKSIGIVLFGWVIVPPSTGFGQETHPAGFSLPQQDKADETAAGRESGTPVHIQVTAVLIHLDKLSQIGLDWDLSPEKLDEVNEKHGRRFYEFVHSLTDGDSAQVIFAPHLRAIAGKKSSMDVSFWNLQVTPKFQENGDIQLDLAMKGVLRLPYSQSAGDRVVVFPRPPEASIEMPFDMKKKVLIRPGETVFLTRPELEMKAASNAKRPSAESGPEAQGKEESKQESKQKAKQAVLLFARVDTKPLERPDAATSELPSMDPPSLKPSAPGYPHYINPRVSPPPVRIPSSVPMSIPSAEY